MNPEAKNKAYRYYDTCGPIFGKLKKNLFLL